MRRRIVPAPWRCSIYPPGRPRIPKTTVATCLAWRLATLPANATKQVNLLAPLWIVPAFEARLQEPLGHTFLLYTYPVIFSAMVFAIPLGRWMVEKVHDHICMGFTCHTSFKLCC